jgi:hypothetical protein
MSHDAPDPAQQLADSNKRVLGYSRKRFLGTWLALGALAILTAIGIGLNHEQQRTLRIHQNVLIHEIGGIRDNQERIIRLTINTAAAICLEAFAKTRAQQIALVAQFNRNPKIDLSHNPACQNAVKAATRLVLGP